MASPYWSYPAPAVYAYPQALQGRISPMWATPPHGVKVFCLGIDAEPEHSPTFMLDIGDTITVEQTHALDAHKLIRFAWRMRQPRYIEQGRTVCRGAEITFKDEGLVAYNDASNHDGLRGVSITRAVSENRYAAVFRPTDRDQLCKVTGSAEGGNNTTCRISSVPMAVDDALGNQVHQVGQVAVLENAALVAHVADPDVTVKVLGTRWVARAYIDSTLRVELSEYIRHEWQRNSLALHMSKLPDMTSVTILFELKLESTEPA